MCQLLTAKWKYIYIYIYISCRASISTYIIGFNFQLGEGTCPTTNCLEAYGTFTCFIGFNFLVDYGTCPTTECVWMGVQSRPTHFWSIENCVIYIWILFNTINYGLKLDFRYLNVKAIFCCFYVEWKLIKMCIDKNIL